MWFGAAAIQYEHVEGRVYLYVHLYFNRPLFGCFDVWVVGLLVFQVKWMHYFGPNHVTFNEA